MSFRKLMTIFTAVVGLALFALSSAPVYAVTIKIATLSPDGNSWMLAIRAGGKEIEKRTNGRVKFKFYPGGVMGNDKSVMRKIRVGQLHGGAITTGALTDIYPDAAIYTLPLLFNTYGEMNYVREHVDKIIIKGLERKGFITFGLSDGGFAYLMSNKPVRTLKDLQGKKIWVPEGDHITMAVFQDMGISPIQLPLSDVYTGLQTGLIDTVGVSPIGALAFQWHTKTKYLTDTPLMYLNGLMIVSKKTFNKIKVADRKIVRQVFGRVFKKLNLLNQKDNLAAKAALKKQGIQFVGLTSKDKALMQGHVRSATSLLISEGAFSKQMVNTVRRYRDSYRSKHRSAAR